MNNIFCSFDIMALITLIFVAIIFVLQEIKHQKLIKKLNNK